MRILEVNNHSLLGMTHTEAVRVLRAVGDSLIMLVCDGFDPRKVAAVEVRFYEQTDVDRFLWRKKWTTAQMTSNEMQSSPDEPSFYSVTLVLFPGVSWHHC